VIHHSDQGSQYTSIAFGLRCREAGVRPSMGSVGDAYDNAMCESFFAKLECALLAQWRFKTQTGARNEVLLFIEGFYNPRRRHSSIGYLSTVEFERRYHQPAVDPGPPQGAAVLAPVKDASRRQRRSPAVVLDRRSARQPHQSAGRDGRMAPLGGRTKECFHMRGEQDRRCNIRLQFPNNQPSTNPGQAKWDFCARGWRALWDAKDHAR
jgi:hypothetical protein